MTTKKTMILAFLMALGIMLQLLESFVPVVMIIPGFKIGLANVVSLFALVVYDKKSMWIVGLGRICLAGLLTGTLFSITFWLSVSGGLFALLAMSLTYALKKFSVYGISVAGAASHSIGQVIAVTYMYQQYFMQLFLPVLLALSIVSGLFIGLFCQKTVSRLKGRLV